MFYLRVLPGPTAWFLLSSIIIWDIFAVLTPLGPLKQITGFAHDYGEDVLRFLMFSTGEVEPAVNERQTAGADSDESMGSESEENSEGESEEVKPKTGKKTAFDALNDSSARLGMGDFVFYSLLVGQAASSGSVLATIAPMIGIIIGLTITLTLLTDGDEATPALPVSVFFGIILHFGTLHLAEPMLNQAFMI
uniref:GDT1 family protein n=2 Tax=Bursaphelenchus xylophilus TaxID=6326 RepID=A0A1I7S8D2_BURXY